MEQTLWPVLRRYNAVLVHLLKSRHVASVSKKYSTQNPQAQDIITTEKIDLTKPSVVKWKRPPFVKNLFLGKFDTELLAFPEILNQEDLTDLEKQVKKISNFMGQKVNSMEIDVKQNIPDECLQDLKDLGLFGRMIPAKYGGLDLTYTACTRINEVLGLDWSISSILAVHEFFATQVILKFGSDEQKSFYLPKLASGNLIASICYTELESGSDILGIKTKAAERTDGSFVISGTKSWVSNAHMAELFVVIANTTNQVDHKATELSVFLVEKGNGVHIIPQEKLGLRGLNTSHVQFEEVVVPASSVIGTVGNGYDVYLKALESFRLASSTFTFGALKSLLDSVTNSVIHKERVEKSLADYEMVRMRLSRVNAMIYGMESVSYYTAAILDSTEDPDIAFEAAALKIFNSEGTLFCIEQLMEALGSCSLMPGAQLERFHRDAKALSMIDCPNDLCRLFLGIDGCRFIEEKKRNSLTQWGKPVLSAKERWKHDFRQWKIKRRVFHFDQDIAGHIHPSLVEWGNEIEKRLQTFEILIDELLNESGKISAEFQLEPMRLANIATELYVWSAVLSRASRSYCIGLTNCHHEIRLAEAYCFDANERVMFLIRELMAGIGLNNDRNHLLLGAQVIDCQGYFAEHPLKHKS